MSNKKKEDFLELVKRIDEMNFEKPFYLLAATFDDENMALTQMSNKVNPGGIKFVCDTALDQAVKILKLEKISDEKNKRNTN